MQLDKPRRTRFPLEQSAVDAERAILFCRTGAAYGIAHTFDWLGRDCGVSLKTVAPAFSREMKASLVALYGLYQPLKMEALRHFWEAQRASLDSILASQNLSAIDEVSIQSDGGNLVGTIGNVAIYWTTDGNRIAHVTVTLNTADGSQVGATCLVKNGSIQNVKKTGNSLTRGTLAKIPWYLSSVFKFEFDTWSGVDIAEFIGSEVAGKGKAAQSLRRDAAKLLFEPWNSEEETVLGPFDPSRANQDTTLGVPRYTDSTKLEKHAWSLAVQVYQEGLRLQKFSVARDANQWLKA
jgi:hypothetical protein